MCIAEGRFYVNLQFDRKKFFFLILCFDAVNLCVKWIIILKNYEMKNKVVDLGCLNLLFDYEIWN